MNTLAIFAIQISLSLVLGLAATAYLRGVTHTLLVDLCGKPGRAEFWVRVMSVLMSIAPLCMVLVFGASQSDSISEIIRQAIRLGLIGIVIAVAVLAMVFWQPTPVAR